MPEVLKKLVVDLLSHCCKSGVSIGMVPREDNCPSEEYKNPRCTRCENDVDISKCYLYYKKVRYVPESPFCGFCNGTGETDQSEFYIAKCHVCEGSGRKYDL